MHHAGRAEENDAVLRQHSRCPGTGYRVSVDVDHEARATRIDSVLLETVDRVAGDLDVVRPAIGAPHDDAVTVLLPVERRALEAGDASVDER